MILGFLAFCNGNPKTQNTKLISNKNTISSESTKNNTQRASLIDSSVKSNELKRTLMAGAAQADITLPFAKNAAENSKTKTAKIIHDKLHVKTLVIDDGTNRIALIVADTQGIPTWIVDRAKKEINRSTGIPISNIMISATHTHSGIIAGSAPINLNPGRKIDEYQILLINKTVESVRNAIKNLEPALIAWGHFDKPQYVFNRRWYMKTPVENPFGTLDSVKTNPGFQKRGEMVKPAGPTDPEIYFIAVKSVNGQPISIFANYSLHYVGVKSGEISADYYGKLGELLAKKLNTQNQSRPFVGIMSNGTSGDINSVDYSAVKAPLVSYERINSVADDIATEIVKSYNQLNFQSWVPIKVKEETLNLKLRSPQGKIKENIDFVQNSKEKRGNNISNERKTYATRAVNLGKLYPSNFDLTLQIFKIGEIGFGTIPLEVFAETGLELKRKIPFKDYFTIGLANGHWGYMPTPQQYKKGGYESWLTVSRFQENASEIIVSELLKMANKLN